MSRRGLLTSYVVFVSAAIHQWFLMHAGQQELVNHGLPNLRHRVESLRSRLRLELAEQVSSRFNLFP